MTSLFGNARRLPGNNPVERFLRGGEQKERQDHDSSSSSSSSSSSTRGGNSNDNASRHTKKKALHSVVSNPVRGLLHGTNQVFVKIGDALPGIGILLPTGTRRQTSKNNYNSNTSNTVEDGEEQGNHSSSSSSSSDKPALPPDETLQNMEHILRKRLHNVSIPNFYDACWSETSTLYESWLQETANKQNLQVSPWEYGNFENEWDQQIYPQRRIITYQYDRDPKVLGYSLGDPSVSVTQTQYFHQLPGNDDRSILSVCMKMKGEVCSDSFTVQIRGVATRVVSASTSSSDKHDKHDDHDDLMIDFGVFCVFTKQVLIAGKIRDTTKEETKASMQTLFEKIRLTCGAEEVVVARTGKETTMENVMSEDDEESDGGGFDNTDCFTLLSFCQPFLFGGSKKEQALLPHTDDIDKTIYDIRQKYRAVLSLQEVSSFSSATKNKMEGDAVRAIVAFHYGEELIYIRNEFTAAQKALEHILVRDQYDDNNYRLPNKATESSATAPFSLASTKKSLTTNIASLFPYKKSRIKLPKIKIWIPSVLPAISNMLLSPKAKQAIKRKIIEDDEALNAMNVVIKDTIDCSLNDFYDTLCTQNNYKDWLEKIGKEDVKISKWDLSKTAEGHVDPSNGERYSMACQITNRYELDLYSPPPALPSSASSSSSLASSTYAHTHRTVYARRDGTRKVVIAIRYSGTGVWFGDSCDLNIRWVVTPFDDEKINNNTCNRVRVKIGMFAVVRKYTILARKIRAEATRAIMQHQHKLLKQMKIHLGCSNRSDFVTEISNLTTAAVTDPMVGTRGDSSSQTCVPFCWSTSQGGDGKFSPGSLLASDDDLVRQALQLERKFQAVEVILKDNRDQIYSTEDLKFFLSQLVVVSEALDNVIQNHRDSKSSRAAKEVQKHAGGF